MPLATKVFTRIILGLLLTCSLQASAILVDVSGDPNFPFTAVQGNIFDVGYPSTQVQFNTGSSAPPTYTSVSTGMFFSVMGWTNIYTLLGRDLNPVEGAYLAITIASSGDIHYQYSLNPGATWDFGMGAFTSSSSTTWTDIANTLFPPPPPPVQINTQPVFLPPPVIITSNIGPITNPYLGPLAIDNPEPGTWLMFVGGAAALYLWNRRLRKA